MLHSLPIIDSIIYCSHFNELDADSIREEDQGTYRSDKLLISMIWSKYFNVPYVANFQMKVFYFLEVSFPDNSIKLLTGLIQLNKLRVV